MSNRVFLLERIAVLIMLAALATGVLSPGVGTSDATDTPTAPVLVKANKGNRAPVLDPVANQRSSEGDAVDLLVSATDPDGHQLTYRASGLPGGLSMGATSGRITGTVGYDQAGSHRVSITVTDDGPKSRSATTSFTWSVADVNRAPVLEAIGERSVAPGSQLEVPVSAADPDGDVLVLSAEGLPPFATLVTGGPGQATLLLAPSNGDEGVHPVTVRVSDGSLDASETFDVVVIAGPNRAPTISEVAGPIAVAEGSSTQVDLTAGDPDGDETTLEVAGEPSIAGFAQLVSTGPGTWRLTLTPGYDHAGSHAVLATVSDGELSATVGFVVEVSDTNRPPTISDPGDQTGMIGEDLVVAPVSDDPDGDPLSYTATGLPAGIEIDQTTGRLQGRPTGSGSWEVTVTVSDGRAEASASFMIVVTEPPQGPRVDLGLLLIGGSGDEPSLKAWQQMLESHGVSYDLRLAGDQILPESLSEGSSRAYYQGVVIATSATWELLSPDERAAIDGLQDMFGIRKVVSYVYPSSTYGLTGPTSGGLAVAEGEVTAAGRQQYGYLAGPVPFEPWAWGYVGAQPLGTEGFTTLVTGADGSALVGIHRGPSGREQLVTTVDHAVSTIHTPLLLPGMLTWVTRGVHTGSARDYLALHIDDVLLGDDRWDTETNTTVEDGPDPIRMTAADVTRALAWQDRTGIVLDMVYNGLGATEYGSDDPLTTAVLAQRDRFRWINHTFTHENLDTASEVTIVDEVQRNTDWANANGVDIDPAELVTGQHSGLSNTNMPGGLSSTGIRWIASDNSRTPQQTAIGPALTVPRHPANIYYNVGTRAEQLDEYNYVYHDGCVPIPGVHTCLTAPVTWEEYVDAEATIMLRHVLGNDPRPHYMHQSNLAEDGVLYDVVDEVLSRYQALFTSQLVQPTLTQAGELLRDHAAWSAALRAGTVTGYLQGDTLTLSVSPGSSLLVPLTGTAIGELHRGSRTGWVRVDGEATFRLAEAPGFGPLLAASTTSLSSTPVDAPTPASVEAPLPLAPATPLEE